MVTSVEQAIRDYLNETVHLSLATCADGRPWVCEVHFAYDQDLNLYFRSLPSRRHSLEIARNPLVAGNIVTQHALGEKVRGVYFEGEARALETEAERRAAFAAMRERLGTKEEALEDSARPDGHWFYRIAVENFYLFDGRESQPGRKYELPWNGGKP